jgi:uncharacterized oligopeptide transporter (OPT) family protein
MRLAAQVRYLGVGAMLVGGVWALISIRSSLLSGVKSGLAAARAGAASAVAHTEQDLPMKAILVGIVLFTLPLFVLYQNIVGSLAVSLPMTIIMIVAGFSSAHCPPTWRVSWAHRTTRCQASRSARSSSRRSC